MKLYGLDGSPLMDVSEIRRDGSSLVIKGKIFGTMPLSARLEPKEVRSAMRLLNLRLIVFILSLPFRRARPNKGS